MTEVLLDNLCFGEGPRWHENELWFSDMHAQTVLRVSVQGQATPVVEITDDQPSGLGWLPSGDLLIVCMTSRQIRRFDGNALTVHADLGDLASWYCNDMVVDAAGRAYVGNFWLSRFYWILIQEKRAKCHGSSKGCSHSVLHECSLSVFLARQGLIEHHTGSQALRHFNT